jgi:hypothetical protein
MLPIRGEGVRVQHKARVEIEVAKENYRSVPCNHAGPFWKSERF